MGKQSRRDFMRGSSTAGLALMASGYGAGAAAGPNPGQASAPAASQAAVAGVSGQGNMKFKVLYTSSHLPEAARKVLIKAHGGFAVDRRPGKGEAYFALPGVGILQISSNLKEVRILDTAESMKKVNLHDTTLWTDSQDGAAYLAFPSNDAGKIFTTTLEGTLVSTLDAPGPDDEFEQPAVHNYFLGGGNFAPTGLAYLDGFYYVTTGYCNLDFSLRASVEPGNASKVVWNDLAFGGRGDGAHHFQTAHAIAVYPGA
ncbi:MAG: hypothetical protein KGM47_03020, partial [Acidobacteriota bacterium]|nr:hypothetical protein [Acidobacteriota bacterium]